MLKPPMPNIPGVGAVSDTLDFVKNLWGSMSVPGMSIPGMAAPTLSVEDLDKKIADLKAVESWLNVNTAMLRGTIQALEVQRGTISTLKSMGATLAAAVKQPGANEKSVLEAAPFASAFFAQPVAEAVKERDEAPAAAKPDAAALPNPGAWWNMLQDQFKSAVSTAMSSEAMANASAMAQDAAAKLAAASVRPAEQFSKAMAKATPPAAAPDKAPAKKRAAAKPAARKPKAPKP
ncbi:MAG: PhaM family polyhydroxyalkanoate granule multifunctional regulatory protein [Pseudomonadota bacterium]